MPTKKMKVSETPKAARHIDRLRSNTMQDFDWHPTDARRGERVRDETGVHMVDEGGLEVVHGSRSKKKR
jgi:hypothetical protein